MPTIKEKEECITISNKTVTTCLTVKQNTEHQRKNPLNDV